jgi:hypothetical protein
VLASCGGGGGGGGAVGDGPGPGSGPVIATAADNLFPLDTNGLWAYDTSTGGAPVTSRVTGLRNVAGASAVAVRNVDPAEGLDITTLYVASASGVRQYADAGASALERALDGIEVLRWGVAAGTSWVQFDRTVNAEQDFDGDGRSDSVAIRAEATAVGLETVTTPAGTFERCLRMRQNLQQTLLSSRGLAPITVTAVIEIWLAPGVGPVRTTSTFSSPSGTSSETETLREYRVGTRSSDTVAPTVQSTTPIAAVRGFGASVTAVFSEPMDPDSVTASSFTVVDADGRAVAGSVSLTDLEARFEPAQPWASGSYTAQIGTAARDRLGNALACARSWSFSVDATGPGIVSTSPAAGAVDVALDSSIVVRFSEAVDPASVNASSVMLSVATVPVPVQLSVNGAEVTVRPSAPLAAGTSYMLRIFNVTDLVGNAFQDPGDFSFATLQGRFSWPRALAPDLASTASASGDVTGDGVADLVFVGQGLTHTAAQALYVMAGQADGTLASPVQIVQAADFGCPYIGPLALGDFNGDGRLDLALGGPACDLLVLHQAAGGALQAGQRMAGANALVLRAADLDGDGRTDLVSLQNPDGVGRVLRQSAQGELVADPRLLIGLPNAVDLVLGDVNGDGRPDALVCSASTGSNLSISLQQPDGRFQPIDALRVVSNWGCSSAALADLNGDGRTDIVVTTGGAEPSFIAVLYQRADGSMAPPLEVATHGYPSAVQVVDVDGDGRADVVVAHGTALRVGLYLGKPDGTLAAEQLFVILDRGLGANLLVADLTRDGRPDILFGGSLLRQLPVPAGAMGGGVRSQRVGGSATAKLLRALGQPVGQR